jgi:hypothetical protein
MVERTSLVQVIFFVFGLRQNERRVSPKSRGVNRATLAVGSYFRLTPTSDMSPRRWGGLFGRTAKIFRGGQFDRSNVTILRGSPLSANSGLPAKMMQRSVVDARILSPLRKNNH